MRIGVVLFNLGGPDCPAAVEPFLFNLFNDSAIIGAPRPIRWCLAKFISRKRAPVAREIYDHLGGGSPLLANTEAQARALERQLNAQASGDESYKVAIAMRYWHPFSAAAVESLKSWGAEELLLLPLYPQFSTTTVGSSLKDWRQAAATAGLDLPTRAVCCYPTETGLVKAMAEKVRPPLAEAAKTAPPRLLFSAHGLPKKVVSGGDPYQWQVEQSARAVVEALADPALDWRVCYQSRIGPLEWIGPSIDTEIERAVADGKAIVVMPVAFVSEHSETLVELDIEYRKRAENKGAAAYLRVGTVDCAEAFIQGLAGLVHQGRVAEGPITCDGARRRCSGIWSGCPLMAHDGERA